MATSSWLDEWESLLGYSGLFCIEVGNLDGCVEYGMAHT